MTSSENNKETPQITAEVKEEPNNKLSPDYAEGLVPPANQEILMPYYVKAGDNLAKISKRIYGESKSWKKIAELNHLIDANKIYAGDVIYYTVTDRSKIFAETYENAPKAKIIVKKGDTLYQISKVVFGKAKDWRVLWKENPQIMNPDRIKVGTAIYFRPKALTADASAIISNEKGNDNKETPMQKNSSDEILNSDNNKNNNQNNSALKEDVKTEDKVSDEIKSERDNSAKTDSQEDKDTKNNSTDKNDLNRE
ncbi:hypothetical protein AXG55_00360 [Silvanigrella aquatica]|uniref:LysM domain-containing protein n=2 Tax=Silvanigrella aquatica TaxID=1915309 RepID=A0A1L4CWZ8_9BACT|nr:hypothetical protein AXG55_00360 [Silvanigrella aquatica]